jgi:hypothetical protein
MTIRCADYKKALGKYFITFSNLWGPPSLHYGGYLGDFSLSKVENVKTKVCEPNKCSFSVSKLSRDLEQLIKGVPDSCTEPDVSNPHPQTLFPRTPILILFCNLRLGFPSGLFHSGFPTRVLRISLSPHEFL